MSTQSQDTSKLTHSMATFTGWRELGKRTNYTEPTWRPHLLAVCCAASTREMCCTLHPDWANQWSPSTSTVSSYLTRHPTRFVSHSQFLSSTNWYFVFWIRWCKCLWITKMQKLFTPTTVAGWAGMRCCQYFSIKRNLIGIIVICNVWFHVIISIFRFYWSSPSGFNIEFFREDSGYSYSQIESDIRQEQ